MRNGDGVIEECLTVASKPFVSSSSSIFIPREGGQQKIKP